MGIEAAVGADLGPVKGDGEDHENCADAAGDYGNDGTEVLGDEAGFEAAEFIGGADEEAVDGADAAALFVRSEKLDEGMADDDANVVGEATKKEHGEGKKEIVGKAENDRGDSEDGHRGEKSASGFLDGRSVGHREGADERTDGERSLEKSEARGAGMENVFGEDWKERSCATEQDRKQIERDNTEDDGAGENELETDNQTAKGHWFARRGRMVDVKEEHKREAGQGGEAVKDVNDGGGMSERDERSARGWADDRGEVKCAGVPGEGARELGTRDELGKKSGTGGPDECASTTGNGEAGVNPADGRVKR